MGTYLNTAVDNNFGSDAEYQAWCQAYEAAFLASGFLEVAPDTGQLNLATMVRPALNAFGGYRIYRAKDDRAAARPFYIKLEYGLAGGTVNGAMVRRTLGNASDGAGNLTGPGGLSASQVYSPTATGAGVQTILGGGGAHSAWVYVSDTSQNTHQAFFCVGRLLDSADASALDPLLYEIWTSSLANSINVMNYTADGANWATPGSGLGTIYPQPMDVIHTGGSGGNALVFEGQVYRSGKKLVVPALVGRPAELPYNSGSPGASTFSLSIWGGLHTFLPLPHPALSGGAQRLAFLYE